MEDVAANRKIEGLVRSAQIVRGLILELETRRQASVARTGELEMLVENIDTEYVRARKELREARGYFAGAAAYVENPRLVRQRITANQRNLLRPNRARLCVQIAHHGLVGLFFRLRVDVGHAASLAFTSQW